MRVIIFLLTACALSAGVLGTALPIAAESEHNPLAARHPRKKESPWSVWQKRREPVLTHKFHAASDPAILKEQGMYRMFYTCYDPAFDETKDRLEDLRLGICEATSTDGFTWQDIRKGDRDEGLVLLGIDGTWEELLEASYIVKKEDEYLLYYSGYRLNGNPQRGFPAALSVARSRDGVRFQRAFTGPILEPTPGWYDNDAIYSPVIVPADGGYFMIYAGHCYTNCEQGPGVFLLGATSRDGFTWTKQETPLLGPSREISWMREGAGEPGILAGPDGYFYLFFTGLNKAKRVIGVARSRSLSGPWEINPKPIVKRTRRAFDSKAVLAADVMLENSTVRMWYLGEAPKDRFAIGYAESPWPLYTDR